ncbi:protein of unknown function [Pararobbsia alpina]
MDGLFHARLRIWLCPCRGVASELQGRCQLRCLGKALSGKGLSGMHPLWRPGFRKSVKGRSGFPEGGPHGHDRYGRRSVEPYARPVIARTDPRSTRAVAHSQPRLADHATQALKRMPARYDPGESTSRLPMHP